ncbi:hypothetical protein [Actinacidiphila rubida]|uniref:Uncharacterized protein n=1 Tax=Actinacidiphila rubida TaxID=310780 RepID=A0A1H8SZT6_9ACTN|nr:hypothetical protein [Actinacidiphila rubida]SEO83844.1 hypothetical protein SAMN05216267_104669 [Actinacidiphila rubida]
MSRHLVKGLRILGERWTKGVRGWLAAGTNWLDTGVRWALVLGTLYGAAHLLLGSLLGVGAVALVVCVLALRAATKAARGQQLQAAKPGPQASAADAEQELPDVTGDELAALAHDLLAGGPGVHLATLAAGLTARHGGDWQTGDVRALLTVHQVPVRPSVRDAAKRVSPGVHRADLPPLPAPSLTPAVAGPVAVVAAGQPGTTGATTDPPATPTTRQIGGVQVTSIPDPANPARTIVRAVDRTRKRPA